MTKKELIEEILKLDGSYTKATLTKMKKNELEKILDDLKADTTSEGELLSLSKAKKISKKFDEIVTYELQDGSIYRFYPYFSETLIEEMLMDYQILFNEAIEKGIELSDSLIYHLMNLIIIKHASPSLKEQFKDDFLFHVEALESLRNAGYYREIINHALVPEEVQKVRDAIVEKIAEGNVLDQMLRKVMDRMKTLELENRDIIEKFEQAIQSRG